MKPAIISFLLGQGLNSKAIRVYLDIYKYGQSFASSIATRTDIDRTTVYAILKRLLKQSIIVKTKIDDIHAYIPVSPKVFMDKIDRQIEDLNIAKKTTALFVEEMTKIQKRSFLKPRTKIYEGKTAIITLYLHTLQKNGLQKSFLSIKSIPATLKDFMKNEFMRLKMKNNVFSKVLVANTPFAPHYKAMDTNSNRQTKIIEKHPFELHSEILLYNKTEVAMIDFREDIYGVVIESETLYKSIETLFDYIWANEK